MRVCRNGGFSLVEAMIAVAIFAIALSIGAPMFGTFIQNNQVRNAAEIIQNGLQLARSDAVQRNVAVAYNIPAGAMEGANNAVLTVNPLGTTAVTFNGLGQQVAGGGTVSIDITNPVGGNCIGGNPRGPIRCLRVVVLSGGVIRMCDPTRAATDPQGCPS